MEQNKIVNVLADWSEEDKWGEVGERRLSHCSSVVGEGGWEWAGEEATEGSSTSPEYEILSDAGRSSGNFRWIMGFGYLYVWVTIVKNCKVRQLIVRVDCIWWYFEFLRLYDIEWNVN